MRKVNLIFLVLIIFGLSACEAKTEIPEELTLEYFLEKNGGKVEEVIEFFYGRTGEKWEIIAGIDYIHPGGLIFERAIYYGDNCIGFEMESEQAAKNAVKEQLKISNSLHYKGKFVFPARLYNFVFFYDEDEIKGNRKDGYWIEENCEKTLLLVGINHPVEDGVIIIDGYQRISELALAGVKELHFKNVIIGEDVKILYAGAITGKRYDKIEFVGDIEEIHGSLIAVGSHTFYTVIPNSVKYLGKYAFGRGNIYCEQPSKPENWDSKFVFGNAKVYWAGEWEYDENGIPKPVQDNDNITPDNNG